jgi:diguanylate cyclase (GGDEF)-like protein
MQALLARQAHAQRHVALRVARPVFAARRIEAVDFLERRIAAGDALLQEIAQRLPTYLRGNDTVARLGGDEFALVLEEIDEPQTALQLCEKLCAALGGPYSLHVNGEPIEVRVGASIGIAPYAPGEHADAEGRLMHAADNAMYQAKRNGKNCCVLAD